jgi:hypothetical protein
MIALRESDRAAGLIKKCWDMGSIHAEGPNPLVAVEIERQLDYIRQDDHGCGGRSRCCGQGAGCRANATGSALESADQRAASLADQAGGSGPSHSSPPHPGRRFGLGLDHLLSFVPPSLNRIVAHFYRGPEIKMRLTCCKS